ncbi:hypothetical protein F9K33_14455 [bacterium]|nr:MAG: hypothetical protein F9K33_14455 [bacterium]
MKSYFVLFVFYWSIFVLTAGGRIASSDETAFFLETQSAVEHGTLAVPDTVVNNGSYGRDGKFYIGGGIGYTFLSVPFYALGKLVIEIFPIPENYRVFILKGFFSLTNQFVCAMIGVLFFVFCRRVGYSSKISFFLTAALLFTTNLFPYAKSSMREPLLTLCLLAAAYGLYVFKAEKKSSYLHLTGFAVFYMMNTKISFAVLLPVIAVYFILIYDSNLFVSFRLMDFKILFGKKAFWRDGLILMGWIVAAFTVIGVYNYIQFGSLFSSGYTNKPQPFNNPLWRGIHGLLFSSGKSFFLYAPITVLFLAAAPSWIKSNVKEAVFFGLLFLVMLVLHAKYFAWAGDGSWGPRYLIPVIPFFILPMGSLLQNSLEQSKKMYKFAALSLCVIGLLIQLGGVSVYLGSYLRYIGEYPYKKDFSDPEFLYQSRYVPEYSPVIGHWKLLFVSLEKHMSGEIGIIKIDDAQKRIPIADAQKVIYLIDYWFMYMFYAGFNTGWVLFLFFASALTASTSGFYAFRLFVKAQGARG